jgi:hypothetical protein
MISNGLRFSPRAFGVSADGERRADLIGDPEVPRNPVGGHEIKFPERGKVVVRVEREPGASRPG